MTDSSEKTESAEPEPASARRPGIDRRRSSADGLASLVGSGGSQVGTNGAMRARDVSRPR